VNVFVQNNNAMIDLYWKRDQTYDAHHTYLMNLANDTLDQLILGKDPEITLGLFSVYHLIAQMAYEGVISPTPEDIECISEILFCNGVDTALMNQLYGLDIPDPYEDPGDSRLDGIDYMQVEGDDIDHPINRVR